MPPILKPARRRNGDVTAPELPRTLTTPGSVLQDSRQSSWEFHRVAHGGCGLAALAFSRRHAPSRWWLRKCLCTLTTRPMTVSGVSSCPRRSRRWAEHPHVPTSGLFSWIVLLIFIEEASFVHTPLTTPYESWANDVIAFSMSLAQFSPLFSLSCVGTSVQ